jgi:hypothetical protein
MSSTPRSSRALVVRVLLTSSIVVAALASSAPAQVEVWSRSGYSRDEMLGSSVAFLGDVNGDGVVDFVTGGPTRVPGDAPYAPGTGRVRVFSGADGSQLWFVDGAPGALFGSSVADAGDVDGDGVDDVVVGAPLDGDGAAFVYSGASGQLLRTIRGTTPSALLGTVVCGLGDVNGDGHADFAVGAPGDSTGGTPLGLAIVCSGLDGSTLASFSGASSGGKFGSSLADAGDVDGDGVHDLAVVEQADATSGVNAGTLRVYSGATAKLVWSGALNGATSLWVVNGGGDVDADGRPDLLVGNLSKSGTVGVPPVPYDGEVDVWSGATGAVFQSQFGTALNYFGHAVAAAGDVDGDGFGDYFVGAAYDSTIRLFSGRTGALVYQVQDPGNYITQSLGWSIDGGRDVDGDGKLDAIVGAPNWTQFNPIFSYPGRALLIDATTGATHFDVFGVVQIDELGSSVAVLDDVDGDGVRDAVVGRLGFDTTAATDVVSGVDGSVIRTLDQRSGVLLALPDLDADGIGDFCIGRFAVGVVDVVSGASGTVLLSLQDAAGAANGFGSSVAFGVQPTTGQVQLAVGSPHANNGGTDTGSVSIFDLATGTQLLRLDGRNPVEELGTSVAFLGDVNGDGVGDWAAGAPFNGAGTNNTGRVASFSGSSGKQLKSAIGARNERLGWSISACGDQDGDGVVDLLVGANSGTKVYVYSGDAWTRLRTITSPDGNGLGRVVVGVGDVNGDGVSDLYVGHQGGSAGGYLYSGATGGLLCSFPWTTTDVDSDRSVASSDNAASAGRRSMNGDRIPDLVVGSPNDFADGDYAGRVARVDLDDLFVEFAPPAAPAGAPVDVATRGGPANQLVGLFAIDLSGTPLDEFVAFGLFGATGVWTYSDVVPSGLAGDVLTVRSYAVGFGGKLVDSGEATFTFE